MRIFFVGLILTLSLASSVFGQTTTVSSGNYSDGSVWSTGAVPAGTATVNVLNPLILDQNITISTGTFSFFSNVTDLPGSAAAQLTMTGGTLDIRSGTTTFEGTASLTNATLTVRNGATLILGATTLNNGNTITIEAGGTLIINGNLLNSNSAGTITLNGIIQVNGDYTTNNGNIDLGGTGDIFATGKIDTQGSSDVFGSTTDCASGPCSGRNLCSFSNTLNPNTAQLSCSPSSAIAFNATTVGGSPVYSWQISTSSSTSGFSQVATTEDYTTPAYTQTTWVRRVVTESGCTAISTPVQITVLASGSWSGATSSDWGTASNWCGSTIPTSTTNVVIPSGVPNFPNVGAGTTATVANLTINSGASVTLSGASNAILEIYGNLTNNGTFTANTSSVTRLIGTTQATISGSPVTFASLTINKTGVTSPQVTVNSFLTASGTLTLTAGRVDLSGFAFTLGTNTGNTGSISGSAATFYNGDFVRWFNSGSLSGALFPLGTSTRLRPFSLTTSSNITTGGTIRVGHTGALTTTAISLTDGASTVQVRQNSYWRVSSSGVVGGTFTIDAGGTGFDNISNTSHLRLIKFNGTTNSVVGTAGANSGTVSPGSNVTVQRTGVTLANLAGDFYMGSIDIINSPLPVELAYFRGALVDRGVELDWATFSQTGFDYFQIERLTTGREFEVIGVVDGSAETRTKILYNFIDANPQVGRNYYRLKAIDLDGSFDYSDVIVIRYDGAKELTLYPNPASGDEVMFRSNFEVTPSDVVVIFDNVGKLAAYGTVDTEGVIRFSRVLAPGAYLVKYAGQSYSTVKRLIVR